MIRPPLTSPLFPYTTLFRSEDGAALHLPDAAPVGQRPPRPGARCPTGRSEEHTSELQSHVNLVCRLLLEKKKLTNKIVVACWRKMRKFDQSLRSTRRSNFAT